MPTFLTHMAATAPTLYDPHPLGLLAFIFSFFSGCNTTTLSSHCDFPKGFYRLLLTPASSKGSQLLLLALTAGMTCFFLLSHSCISLVFPPPQVDHCSLSRDR